MSDKCKYKNECSNPEEEGCLLGLRDFKECPYLKEGKEQVKDSGIREDNDLPIYWTGNSFGEVDLKSLTYERRPYIIGLVGSSNAGKTTLLATLYMLLRSGEKFKDFSFVGSKTLLGWENLAHFLTLKADNQTQFPPHTSRNSGRMPGMLHLRLKDKRGLLHDFLFTDAPGEWFQTWANKADDENAKGARWIDANSDAFLLFADCNSFVNNTGEARLELKLIAERLRNNIESRNVALVWSKSDLEVKEKIKSKIEQSICDLLPILSSYNVSVKAEGDAKLLLNIIQIFNWIMKGVIEKTNIEPRVQKQYSTDYFFAIR